MGQDILPPLPHYDHDDHRLVGFHRATPHDRSSLGLFYLWWVLMPVLAERHDHQNYHGLMVFPWTSDNSLRFTFSKVRVTTWSCTVPTRNGSANRRKRVEAYYKVNHYSVRQTAVILAGYMVTLIMEPQQKVRMHICHAQVFSWASNLIWFEELWVPIGSLNSTPPSSMNDLHLRCWYSAPMVSRWNITT